MRILFIRHADPDYSIDSLTEVGFKEAAALAKYLSNERIDYIYNSPLGRAKRTMEAYLEESKTEVKPIECWWLREFSADIRHGASHRAWDFLPEDIEEGGNDAYSLDRWKESLELYRNSEDMHTYANEVLEEFEKLLNHHGCVKENHHFRITKSNDDTIAFFCHFGIEAYLLSYLLNSSPLVIWQGFIALPSSVTTVYTEERRDGIALFRVSAFGDTSHLALEGMKPSFSGRFCERYTDDTRHD